MKDGNEPQRDERDQYGDTQNYDFAILHYALDTLLNRQT